MSVQWRGQFVRQQIATGVVKGLAASAIVLQRQIKATLTSGGASNKMAGGKPSRPGRPPAVQTGTLRRSIQVDLSRNKGKRPVARVGTAVVYARIHEFGGRISAKSAPALVFQLPDGTWRRVQSVYIPARPYFRPSIKRARDRMLKAFRSEIDLALRRGGKGGGT